VTGTYVMELQVTDNSGATDTDSLTITIEPCKLPCEGQAEKCRYALWFQKPDPNHTITHRTGKAVIILTDENGQNTTIDVLNIFNGTLDTRITFENYDTLFTQLADKLNSVIPPQFLGNNQPMFSYDANQLLVIERYVCHDVIMDLQLTLVTLEMQLHVIYDNNGITIENGDRAVKVPKFGCTNINKCSGESEEVCKEPLLIEDIVGQQEVFGQSLFRFLSKPDFDRYYWYFQDGRPISSDQKVAEHVNIFSNGDPLVRLLVVNNNGCFGILQKNVKLEIIVG